jgi:hypothetical protein
MDDQRKEKKPGEIEVGELEDKDLEGAAGGLEPLADTNCGCYNRPCDAELAQS